jgi:hypothetical protein
MSRSLNNSKSGHSSFCEGCCCATATSKSINNKSRDEKQETLDEYVRRITNSDHNFGPKDADPNFNSLQVTTLHVNTIDNYGSPINILGNLNIATGNSLLTNSIQSTNGTVINIGSNLNIQEKLVDSAVLITTNPATVIIVISANDFYNVYIASNGGNITYSLPNPSTSTGSQYTFKCNGTTTATVNRQDGGLIDANLTVALGNFNALTVYCDGTNWWIFSRF